MRRYLALAVVGMAVLALALAGGSLTLPETLAKTPGSPIGPPGLETKFSGGWLMVVHEPGNDVEVCLGLGAGGLVVMNGTPNPAGKFNTTATGSWKATGPCDISISLLLFVRDYSMNLGCYEVGSVWLTLSPDGNRLEGEGNIYIYLPGQDPLDPEEEPVMAVPVPIDARRIAIQ